MDILLTHGYFLDRDPVERRVMKPYPPLGILSLSAWLKREGFSIGVFDSTFRTLDAFREMLERERPLAVGIYVNMVTKFAALEMIGIAKGLGIYVILGGPEPASYAEEFLNEGADVIVIGEGELTLTEILRHRATGVLSIENINGIVTRRSGGSILRTPPREKIRDLDSLPVPDREAIELHDYMSAWRLAHGYSSVSIISMRGCPYTCKWCSHAVYGESYRRRSPAVVADEIAAIIDTWSPDTLWFADDVFTINHKWLYQLEEELRQRKLTIGFECISRADRLNSDVVAALARMGCRRIWIGAESGSQRILDAMSRGVKASQVEAMTRACRAAGIEVGTFIMLGYGDENKADIEETVRYLRRSQPDIVLTTVSYPIKGTRYYEESNGSLIHPGLPFSQWNDRNIGIRGRYSNRFYWYASRRIVNETAASRLWHSPRKDWRKLVPAFVKAKAAQIGMWAAG